MWVARDKYRGLHLFKNKPTFSVATLCWHENDEIERFELDSDLFDISYEDDPIEVYLVERKKFKFALSNETINALEKETGKSIKEMINNPLGLGVKK